MINHSLAKLKTPHMLPNTSLSYFLHHYPITPLFPLDLQAHVINFSQCPTFQLL